MSEERQRQEAEKYRILRVLAHWTFGERQIQSVKSACESVVKVHVVELENIIKRIDERGEINREDIEKIKNQVSELKTALDMFKGGYKFWIALLTIISTTGAILAGLVFFR